MKTFWIVFILVLLFVIGSASALRYFGNRPMRPLPPAKKQQDDK
jgi:hypothetical protein